MSEAPLSDRNPFEEPTPASPQEWFTGWDEFSANAAPPAELHSEGGVTSAETDPQPPADMNAAVNLESVEQQLIQANSIESIEQQLIGANSLEAIEQQLASANPNPPNAVPQMRSKPGGIASWAANAAPNAAIALPGWSGAAAEGQPNMAELISLIQELNQCNSALLDRVALLEDALEQRQIASSGVAVANDSGMVTALQEQNAQVLNQLEIAHQTNQRQQILVETLTNQLENGQERIAQLERECAIAHQRYGEQVQLLAQSEVTCRDLKARLQRQQRYTLQYKAALEKCLEAPLPGYGVPIDLPLPTPQASWAGQATAPFTPKVQTIRPWSADGDASAEQSKLESLIGTSIDNSSEPTGDDTAESAVNSPSFAIAAAEESIASPPTLPTISDILSDADVESAAELAETPAVFPEVAEAEITALSPEAIQVGLSELEAALGNLLQDPTMDATPGNQSLWQDLARLIAVSPEEIIKAGTADNVEAFTTPVPEIPQRSTEPTLPVSATVIENTSSPIVPAETPDYSPVDEDEQDLPLLNKPIAQQPAIADLPGIKPNWPAPIVYPLRATRKLSSLAAVELPTFPKPQGSAT